MRSEVDKAGKVEGIMNTVLALTMGFTTWLAAATVFAADAVYDFATIDIGVPGQPGQFAFPGDINSKGTIVTNIRVDDLSAALVVDSVKAKNRKPKTATFSCMGAASGDTWASSINDGGQITGGCVDSPSAPGKQFGFVRDKKGNPILLDFPGADGTAAFGISNNGKVTGQFYGPLRSDHGGALSYRFHCFIWDPGTNQYTQLDFPVENTYVSCSSINNRGQVLGEYITVTLQNETLEHGWFVYDNGNFVLDFPLSMEHVGGPAISLSDMNDRGQIIGQRWNGGADWDGIFLYDDGEFLDIELPTGWLNVSLGGMNDKAQFVGEYATLVGVDPNFGLPIYEHHGFVATPGRAKKSRHLSAKAEQ